MRRFSLTPEARDDLVNIQDYIAQDNPQAAARVINEMFEHFGRLADHPEIGHVREDLTPRRVRFWSIYSYLIVYDPITQPVSIVRVLSGYRNIAAILEK